MDGNEAAAYVAHKLNEVIAIYPITPSSPMGELADQWSAQNRKNIWGTIPRIIEMQSEGGAAGAVHGSLQGGSLTTTFTASQGLLLMLPNMFKIAGELTSAVFHIAARSIAAQALSIFGDHSDVMATRSAGWGMLFSGSVQEVMDMALIAQAATLQSRVPFLHIFDGFRTSHEIQKIEVLPDKVLRNLIDDELVNAHRNRGLNPDHPFVRGTAQNPDVFFQAREAVNQYYTVTPNIVAEVMGQFEKETGRSYKPFDYVGHPEAERVIILMGSGIETADETVSALSKQGEKVGAVKVRLYRPFSIKHLMDVLPSTVKAIATLDRTKEPGASGEPLYLDVSTAVDEALSEGTAPFKSRPVVIGGRYGLSSKEFTPAMVKGLLDAIKADKPRNHFTLGIKDDVTHTSVEYDPEFELAVNGTTQAVFWGLGSDGTVGANKNTIKIIGEETDFFAQGYFVYDSKKAGARTISHLRFGPEPIHKPYLIMEASFVGVHQFGFFERYDTLRLARKGATLLINSPYPPDEMWDKLPRPVQGQIIEKELKVYMIDAYGVSKELGLGVRINTIMQTCFFALSGVLPREEAIEKIKQAIEKTYGKRGKTVVRKNFEAVDTALSQLFEVKLPSSVTSKHELPPIVSEKAPAFVQQVTALMMAGNGDDLPVSMLPADGTYPSGTTQWEKRNIALEVPVWDPDICIQCGKCAMICPHSVIRAKVAEDKDLADAPENFMTSPARWRQIKDWKYTLQVAVEDCTGCTLCVEICPVKDKREVGRKAINMEPQLPLREQGRKNWDFFLTLPEVTDKRNGSSPSEQMSFNKVKEVQLLEPLFEFSGACAGCGETPYIRLLTQLNGDHLMVANATGCSSIYGGNLPTTPWSFNKFGRGPAWSNSLFEDNAEFGLGMRLALDKQVELARERVNAYRAVLTDKLADELLNSPQETTQEIEAQRERVMILKEKLKDSKDGGARDLLELADKLVRKSVWIVGGDGWAYDIGYGGLDHVLASNRNVNVLVLDTEVYSNTGGQASKATSLGAVAKFAAAGKRTPKKDLGLLAMGYGYIYVAQIAMGADENQTIRAFQEAEAYDGPSLIIAYSQCIAHGIDMAKGVEQQDKAVKTGYWPLYRYQPDPKGLGEGKLELDSKGPSLPLAEYLKNEARYSVLEKIDPDVARKLFKEAQEQVLHKWEKYEAIEKREIMAAEADESETY